MPTYQVITVLLILIAIIGLLFDAAALIFGQVELAHFGGLLCAVALVGLIAELILLR